MKVKCVNSSCYPRNSNSPLTNDKIYEVIDVTDYMYHVVNDYGKLEGFFSSRFVNWDKEYRIERLKELLDES